VGPWGLVTYLDREEGKKRQRVGEDGILKKKRREKIETVQHGKNRMQPNHKRGTLGEKSQEKKKGSQKKGIRKDPVGQKRHASECRN